MTEQRSALDNALDLLVYAPVGLALTAAEELPKLAAKGRAQVEGQITMARMVGQFAVTQGRKEIEKRLGVTPRSQPAPKAPDATKPPRSTSPAPTNGASSRAASENGSYERLSGRTTSGRVTDAGASAPAEKGAVIDVDFGATARTEPPGAPTTAQTEEQAAAPAPAPAGGPGPAGAPAPAARGLAIPGYDSLSASQVVQRLAGLSQDELAAVGEYEAAHRGRRTILTRVGQLKG